jgi:hypothetical protein
VGPAFTKAGDTNNYVITLNNTSSGDTPNLTCSVSDTLLGNYGPFVLASGASQVINDSRVTLPGDPDPLVNTATATCSPAGFPNVLTANASHTSDVVHPSFTVTKDCLTQTVPPGGTAIFEVTITNTGDVPLIFNTTETEIPANVEIAAGASMTWEVTMVADQGPIVENTVDVTATLPASYGLDNVLTGTASDFCDVEGGATRTPGFWQTHTDYTTHILNDHLGGSIDLGWRTLTSPEEVFGMFWANNAKESDGSRRNKTCQAQVIGSFHLLAAILNTGLDNGAAVPIDPETGDDLITAMRNALAAGDRQEIQRLIPLLDAYNNGGDDIALIDNDGTLQGRADPNEAMAIADYTIADC